MSNPMDDEFYCSIPHWGMFELTPKMYRDHFVGRAMDIIWLL